MVWLLNPSGAGESRRCNRLWSPTLAACLAGAALFAAATPARAGIIASDDFEGYTAGNALGGTGGSGFSGNWVTGTTAPVVVATGTPLSYTVKNANNVVTGTISGGSQALQFTTSQTNSTTTGVTAAHAFATSSSADEIWARFLVRVDSGAVDGSDFTTLYFGAPVTSSSTGNPNFAYLGSTTAGDFTLRSGSSSTGNGGPNIGTSDVGVTTYLLAARLYKTVPGAASPYTTADLWVNPVLDANNILVSPTQTVSLSSGPTTISSLALRSANLDASPADSILVDEIVYGTAAGDVVPGATGAVPEPSAGLLLLAGAGMMALRRRRRAALA